MTKSKMIEYAKKYNETREDYQIYEAYNHLSNKKVVAFIDVMTRYRADLRANLCKGSEPRIIAKNNFHFTVGYWVFITEPDIPTFVVITKNYEYRYCDLTEELEIIKR